MLLELSTLLEYCENFIIIYRIHIKNSKQHFGICCAKTVTVVAEQTLSYLYSTDHEDVILLSPGLFSSLDKQ